MKLKCGDMVKQAPFTFLLNVILGINFVLGFENWNCRIMEAILLKSVSELLLNLKEMHLLFLACVKFY